MFDALNMIAPPPQGEQRAIAALLEEALKLFDTDRRTARLHIEEARAIVRGGDEADRARNGLLAGWQMQRAEVYIREHLDTRLRIGSVAKIVNLSPSYFSRAFKATKGVPYSDYVLAARIVLAKRLLLTTDSPIAQIALQCGLADQSHLTRVFSRAVGIPPRAWRCRRVADVIEDGADETPPRPDAFAPIPVERRPPLFASTARKPAPDVGNRHEDHPRCPAPIAA
jgi:AraC-like DNA-binding protein